MQTSLVNRVRVLPAWAWNDRFLVGLVLIHWCAAMIVGRATGIVFDTGMLWILGTLFGVLLPWYLLVLLIWRFACMALYIRPERPIRWLVADIRGVIADPERIFGGAFRFLLMAVFVGSFSYFKSIIPYLNPFSWDPLFTHLDRILHGGNDAYALLMALTGTPFATTAINAGYHFWLFLVYFVIFLACFAKAGRASGNTLLVAFCLTFIIGGNILATVFSSAGPVYFARLGYGADFAPLLSKLHTFSQTSPVWALNVQDALWRGHIGGGPISGISAMPSMHMASSTLLALYGFRYARWAGLLLTAFAGLILIGSVQLAWHYAIDSYAGALLAVLCWGLAGRLVGPVER
ncbi:MAG: phosphatase PAP2 family protein [Paracoccaceae bacterium]